MEYPRKAEITLKLEVEIPTPQIEAYLFPAPTPSVEAAEGSALAREAPLLSIPFLADLFDLLNFEGNLGVQSINGWTYNQVKKTLTGL